MSEMPPQIKHEQWNEYTAGTQQLYNLYVMLPSCCLTYDLQKMTMFFVHFRPFSQSLIYTCILNWSHSLHGQQWIHSVNLSQNPYTFILPRKQILQGALSQRHASGISIAAPTLSFCWYLWLLLDLNVWWHHVGKTHVCKFAIYITPPPTSRKAYMLLLGLPLQNLKCWSLLASMHKVLRWYILVLTVTKDWYIGHS